MTTEETHHEKRMAEIARLKMHSDTIAFYGQFIAALKSAKVLDFGAGSGKVAVDIAASEHIESLIAYDTGPEPMRQLKETSKIRKEWSGNYTQLPFPSHTFDVVTCRYVLHHLEQKERALAEIRRVLKPSGFLLVSDAILPEHSRDVLTNIYRVREDHFHGYLTYYELIHLLEGTGFSPLLSRPYRHRYANLSVYLEAVDNGMAESLRHGLAQASMIGEDGNPFGHAFADVLKWKLRKAFLAVDEKVQREMGVIRNGDGSDLSFLYFMVDMAAKPDTCLRE